MVRDRGQNQESITEVWTGEHFRMEGMINPVEGHSCTSQVIVAVRMRREAE